MKEDVLEQLAENYLHHLGYFTCHNVKFRPSEKDPDFISKDDCVYSDIDLLAVHPKKKGVNKVIAVSCKSWMHGFSPASIIDAIENNKKLSGKEAWKSFRELVVPKWSRAFSEKVKELTGQSKFTYWTLVVNLKGEASKWESYKPFQERLSGNPVKLVTFSEIIPEIFAKADKTPSSSELERILQLIKAAGFKITNTK